MADGTDDHDEFDSGLDGVADPDTEGIHEDPPSYHSGRVRIIGAEPAGDAVREVTGPVVEEHPELPHWNDAPTGQVPAVLDTSTGEELVAPPTWREEDTDWEAQEEVFEPSMLSEDLPAVGALLGEPEHDADRQPWHFESDDTLVIPPEPGFESEPVPVRQPEPALPAERMYPPEPDRPRRGLRTSPRTSRPRSPRGWRHRSPQQPRPRRPRG